mgnify:CR=1 FL=1
MKTEIEVEKVWNDSSSSVFYSLKTVTQKFNFYHNTHEMKSGSSNVGLHSFILVNTSKCITIHD